MPLATYQPLQPHECGMAYLTRRAQVNHSPGAHNLMRRAGISEGTLSPFSFQAAMPQLADLLGLSSHALETALFLPVASHRNGALKAFGQTLRYNSVRLSHTRWCPACLAEDGYLRQIWQLAAFTDCPRHAIQLHERCPNPRCNAPIRPNRRILYRCGKCRHDLRLAPRIPSDPGVVALLGDVEHRAYDHPPAIFPTEAAVASIQGFLDLCTQTGQLALGLRPAYSLNAIKHLTMADYRRFIAAAAPVLITFPSGAQALFSRSFKQPDLAKPIVLTDVFPHVYNAITRYPAMRVLLPTFEDYIVANHMDIVQRLSSTRDLFKRWSQKIARLPLYEAAAMAKVSPQKLRTICHRLEIPLITIKQGFNQAHCTLTVQDVDRICEFLKTDDLRLRDSTAAARAQGSHAERGVIIRHSDEASARMAAVQFPAHTAPDAKEWVHCPLSAISRRLAVTDEIASQLVHSEFFRTFWLEASEKSGVGVPETAYWAFEVALSKCLRPVRGSGTKSMSLYDAVTHKLRRFGFTLVDLITAAMRGDISCHAAASGRGLERLRVPVDEIETIAAKRRRDSYGNLAGAEDAVRLLRLRGYGVLSHIARKGHIRPVLLGHNAKQGLGYVQADIDQFNRMFICLAEVLESGIVLPTKNPRLGMRQLAALTLHPVMGPRVDGCRQVFYRRADFERALAEQAGRKLAA